MSDTSIVLAALLHKSLLTKLYFSKYEQSQIIDLLREIEKTEDSKLIKSIISYIETIYISVSAIQ